MNIVFFSMAQLPTNPSPSSICLFINLFAQEEVAKEGWNFGALPAITFDTDLGFQYGGVINLYHYGDGSRYPTYNHSIYLEVSRFTKGSGINRIYYNSDQFGLGTILLC